MERNVMHGGTNQNVSQCSFFSSHVLWSFIISLIAEVHRNIYLFCTFPFMFFFLLLYFQVTYFLRFSLISEYYFAELKQNISEKSFLIFQKTGSLM